MHPLVQVPQHLPPKSKTMPSEYKKEIHKANKKKGQGTEIGKHKFMINYKIGKEKTYNRESAGQPEKMSSKQR